MMPRHFEWEKTQWPEGLNRFAGNPFSLYIPIGRGREADRTHSLSITVCTNKDSKSNTKNYYLKTSWNVARYLIRIKRTINRNLPMAYFIAVSK